MDWNSRSRWAGLSDHDEWTAQPPPPHTISKAIWAAETALIATLNLSEDRQMYALMVIQSVASRVGLAVRFRELDSDRWQVEISPRRR